MSGKRCEYLKVGECHYRGGGTVKVCTGRESLCPLHKEEVIDGDYIYRMLLKEVEVKETVNS